MGYRSAIGAGFDPRRVPTQPVVLNRFHPLAQGLGSFFPLGSNATDLVGATPPASILSSPSFAPTVRGPSLYCPGTGYVSVPDAPAFSIGASGFTITALISINGYGGYHGIANKTSGGSGPWQYWTNQFGGQPTFNAGVVATNPIPIGGVHSIAVTVSSAASPNVSHYLNGLANGTGTVSAITNTSDPVLLGRRADGAVQLNGTLGAVGFYNRVLSVDEVAWIAAEPFAMVRPVVRQQYYTQSGAAPPAVSLDMWHQPASQPYRVRAEMIPY